jgi:hypothetical protein
VLVASCSQEHQSGRGIGKESWCRSWGVRVVRCIRVGVVAGRSVGVGAGGIGVGVGLILECW